MVLDGLDRALLRLLQEDARQSYRTLAARADSTVPTVSARVRRMEQIGIIQGYSVRLDPARFGAAADAEVDLEAAVRLACHTCQQETTDPHWSRIDGRPHPFCCPTCKARYEERYAKAAEGL